MMVSPISRVSFRGTSSVPTTDRTMDAIEKTQKAMNTFANVAEGADEFKKNMNTDSEAYSDAVSSALKEAAEENKSLKPLADVADSKVGKAATSIFGKFTAFCTSLAGAATSIAGTTDVFK